MEVADEKVREARLQATRRSRRRVKGMMMLMRLQMMIVQSMLLMVHACTTERPARSPRSYAHLLRGLFLP